MINYMHDGFDCVLCMSSPVYLVHDDIFFTTITVYTQKQHKRESHSLDLLFINHIYYQFPYLDY
jgi:hypothetical protein